jgi:[acyl-carrier-protein] S-malonyltransferase
MLKIIDQEVNVFVEVGPGRVLTGLLKKILPEASGARIHNVMDLKSLEKFLEAEA